MTDEDSELPPLTPAPKSGFVSGHDTNYAWSDEDVFVSETELDNLLQFGKIFLTSMRSWTYFLVISLCSPTRMPDVSEPDFHFQ